MNGSKKNLSCLSLEQKKLLIDADITISIRKQCKLLSLSRSSLHYKPKPMGSDELSLIKLIDEIYTAHPYYGTRRMQHELRGYGVWIGRQRIGRYYKILGLEALYPAINLSKRNYEHKVYTYLLKHLPITRVNQVWSADITYLKLKTGFVYLVAIIDWYSRRILSWKLSTTLHPEFCVEALQEALDKYPHPEIFNTDQGSQFTSHGFISLLRQNNIRISMDERGRALDNVFIERFWRSLKQEKIYLAELYTVQDAKIAVAEYMAFYNLQRKHQSLGYRTPDSVHSCAIN